MADSLNMLVGPGPFYPSGLEGNNGDPQGGAGRNGILRAFTPTSAANLSQITHAANTNTESVIVWLQGGATHGTTGAYTTTGQDTGINPSVGETDKTGASRRVEAGNWTVTLGFGTPSGTPPVATQSTLRCNLYTRRQSDGALTFIASGSVTFLPVALQIVTAACTITAPQIVMPFGTTFHIECWVDMPPNLPVAATAYTLSVPNQWTPSGGSLTYANVALPGNGLRFLYLKNPTGTIAPSGTIKTYIVKYFTGSMSGRISGVLKNTTVKPLTGAVSVITATVQKVDKKLVGSITLPSGVLIKVDKKLASSTLTPTGAIVKTPVKRLTATITPSGIVIKALVRLLAGTITSSANVIKTYVKRVQGFLYGPAGSGSVQAKKGPTYLFDD